MHKRTFVGLCAALAFATGSPGAHALKLVDTTPPDGRPAVEAGMDSVTYASETLLTTEMTEVMGDSTKYYNVGGTSVIFLSLPGDVPAAAGDIYLVSVALDGMVFRTIPELTAVAAATSGATNAAFTIAAGGAIGDKTVVFRKGTAGIIDSGSALNLEAFFAVSTGGGSATVTLTNQSVAALNIPNVSGMKTHGPAKVIKVASALKETSMANSLTASVESGFKKFKDGMIVGHVGSLTIGVEGHRIATSDEGPADAGAVANLEGIFQNEGTAEAPDSTVSFMGDFSFAEKVFVHGDDDCGAPPADPPVDGRDNTLAGADIRMMEGTGDAEMVTNTTKAVSLDANGADVAAENVSAVYYLCIMVQGDDTDDMDAPRIPGTDAYTAMAKYKALDSAASGPMGMERNLGKIIRAGTTVHLPYLSTNDKFNQRIRIVNRSSADAKYEMEFHGDGDEAGMDAEGMLPANMITVLSLRTDDVVTPGNGSSTSGTLIIETESSMIDVATVQINRETGNTDTVVYMSQ